MYFYLDSSALLKIVLAERESEALRIFLDGKRHLTVSAIARVEVIRATRMRSPQFLDRAEDVLEEVDLMAVTDAILERAAQLEPMGMRSLDAIHVATATTLGSSLDGLVTYDLRMAEGAASSGIQAFSPGAPQSSSKR